MSSNPDDDEARRAVVTAQVAAKGEGSLREVVERVALAVVEAEPVDERAEQLDRFIASMARGYFLPSVPILSNAARSGQLAACFALEVADTLDSIYGSLHRAARIQQGSGGVGVELSALRPRGTPIERSGGRTPGPVAFAELFARSAHVMGLAGRRAGAHLAILRDDHPDIVEFARARCDAPDRFPQLGLAVAISDGLLRAARERESWTLRHPRGDERRVDARQLMQELATSILETGNPTLLFVDRIEADNPTPRLGGLHATNPCGEQPLLDGESCVLGSIHLPHFLRSSGGVDEELLARVVRDAIRFLDDALEVNAWPDDEIARASCRTRKIGLGIMGLADLLLLRGLPYDRPEARDFVGRLLDLVAREADAATHALGEQRGVFPAWEGGPRRRNATTRALAPTGTLSLIAGCSPGLEPFFAPRLDLVTDDATFRWTDRWLMEWLGQRRIAEQPLLDALAAGKPGMDLPGLRGRERELLRRAWEMTPEDQLAMQAVAQHSVDGAVSKTVHLDAGTNPSPDAIVAWIQHARQLGCKGVAFYCHDASERLARIDLRAVCRDACSS